MNIKNFPSYFDAPNKLLQIEGNCGLITAWAILKYFRKRSSAERITDFCGYTKKYGVFTIALAVALSQHKLSVNFFSEFDPNPTAIEKRYYKIAEKCDVKINQAISLDSLINKIDDTSIAVVLYNTPENNGHLTPLLGIKNNNLILPFSDEGFLQKNEFLKRWSEPEIYRQSLIVSL